MKRIALAAAETLFAARIHLCKTTQVVATNWSDVRNFNDTIAILFAAEYYLRDEVSQE